MKVLIAYDGTEYSDAAINDLPKAGLPLNTEAVVVTVGEAWNLPTGIDRMSSGSGLFIHPTTAAINEHVREVTERAEQQASGAADRIRKVFPGWSVSTRARCGKPYTELMSVVEEWSPDLLIVGSHDRSVVGRAVWGSVSHKALVEAGCSVRIARNNESGSHTDHRVLIAVDGSADAEFVVHSVAQRVWAENTHFRLITVDDPFAHSAAGYVVWNLADEEIEDTAEARAWLSRAIDAPLETLKNAGLNTDFKVRWGDAAAMILTEATEWEADSIFLGARGLGRMRRLLLGSVSSAVASKAPCSIEVVRRPG